MIAVGSDDASPSEGGKVQIFEYNDGLRLSSVDKHSQSLWLTKLNIYVFRQIISRIFIICLDLHRKWQKVETLNAITEPVHDVEFAPNLGR